MPIHNFVDSQAAPAFLASQTGIVNAAGGSNGAPVTTVVSFPAGSLPPSYSVAVAPSQAAMVSITGKTSSGFNVVLTPLGTVTLSSGSFDVTVSA